MDLERVYPRFGELIARAKTLSAAVTPLEFGGAAEARRSAAWRISRALLDKISQDLHTARGGSGDANAGLHFQLDDDPQHLEDSEIKSSWRAVRSRLYFTSESHLHALLAALRLPADPTSSTCASPRRPVRFSSPPPTSPMTRPHRAWTDGL